MNDLGIAYQKGSPSQFGCERRTCATENRNVTLFEETNRKKQTRHENTRIYIYIYINKCSKLYADWSLGCLGQAGAHHIHARGRYTAICSAQE